MSQEEQLKRIADSLEVISKIYENPTEWLNNMTRQLNQAMSELRIPAPVVPAQQIAPVEGGPPPGVAVSAIEVKLSEEERKAICERAMADIEEQMSEFRGFLGQALSELPESALKRIGELMKKGEKFKLRRRHGCVYLDFGQGDDDFFLRL